MPQHRHRPPNQPQCVLTSLFQIHVSNEWPPQGPVADVPANEVLRQLAILYLREPNSRVAVLRMEPSHVHGVRVFITLDLANI